MAIPLKYATASQEIPLGYFLDSTDGDSEEGSLTIANTDIKLWKAGATTLANKNSGGATHISNGIYYCTLDATDTNTYGPLVIFVHVTGALAVRVECEVMSVEAYDTLYGTDGFTVDISSTAEASVVDAVWDELTSVHTTAGTYGLKVGSIGTASDMADAVWDEAISGHVVAGSFGEEVQSHSTSAELSTHDGKLDTVDGIVDSILVDTGTDIPASISALNDFDPSTDVVAHVTLVDTTTDVTNEVSADMTKVSGDATAADNLEATYDGTGYTDNYAPAQQQQLNSIAIGTAAISTVADSVSITQGSETNAYTDTHTRNGIYHSIVDATGTTDLYYEFDVGGNGVPVSVSFVGYVLGLNDSIKVFGYNWGSTTWEQIGSIAGGASAVDVERTFSMYATHIGTGANIGKVRVRLYNTGLTTSTLAIDQLYVSYAVVTQSVGYANGAIWVDTVNGTSGSTAFVNGTADNPVDNWSDALSLSSTLNMSKFEIANGSTITLTGAITNYTMVGSNWTLNLNSQSVSGAFILGAVVSGIAIGGADNVIFDNCELGTVSLPVSECHECAIASSVTLTEAGTYYFDTCYSGVAGTSTPSLDFGASVGSTNVNFRHYSGGIEIKNMGQTGTDNMSLEGWGQYIINANCVGGTLAPRGHFKKTDNSGGAVTISDDANFKTSVIATGIAQGSTSNSITLASTASSTDGAYDPAMIIIVAGTGTGQSRLVYQYNGTTKTAYVDRDWKVNPDTTSEYRILAHAGREHVNEGLAQGGTTSTITLNALASSADDAYNHQIIFLRSGTGEDQVRVIMDYDGTTKIATVNENWSVTPDTTTGYVMIPAYACTSSQITDAILGETLSEPTDITDKTVGGILRSLFSRFFNKVTQTASTQIVYKDDETTPLATMTVSDDGTTQTKGEAS